MSKLDEIFDNSIPDNRSKLKESYVNLMNIASHCEDNYLQAGDKAEALGQTKQYVTQSLASVAYQINTLATSMLQMLDLQGVQLSDMESAVNHLTHRVSVHNEKVARREIGILTTKKNCVRTHKIIAPANPEKPMKHKSVPIDYSLLDDVGHGLKISDPAKVSSAKKPADHSESPIPSTPTENVFFVYKPDPDARPPNSPVECDLYATVHKSTGGVPGSPRSIRQYRPSKTAPGGDMPPPPPPPPHSPSDEGQEKSLPTPSPGTASSHPMPPPPPPLPGEKAKDLARGDANIIMPPPPPADMMMMPPPQPADMMVMPPPPPADMMVMPPPPLADMTMPPPNMDASSMPAAPPAVDATPYPANLGLSDEDMPPPPEFIQADNADQSAPAEYMEKVIAIYGYEKNYEDELTFHEDDIIYVLKKNPNGWFEGVLNGVTGLFPGNYVQTVP